MLLVQTRPRVLSSFSNVENTRCWRSLRTTYRRAAMISNQGGLGLSGTYIDVGEPHIHGDNLLSHCSTMENDRPM